MTRHEISRIKEDYNNIMDRMAFHIEKQVWDITLEESLYGFLPLGDWETIRHD
jgi:hypothetical protein